MNRGLLCRVLLIFCVFFARGAAAQVEMGFSVWELVSNAPCKETMTFLGEEEYLLESGDQMLTRTYKFKQFRSTDFYVFSQRTTSNNGLINCSGVVGKRNGARLKLYAKFNAEQTEMTLYSKPDEAKPLNVIFRKKQ